MSSDPVPEAPPAPALTHGRSPLLIAFVGISMGLLLATLIIPARQQTETITVEALPGGQPTAAPGGPGDGPASEGTTPGEIITNPDGSTEAASPAQPGGQGGSGVAPPTVAGPAPTDPGGQGPGPGQGPDPGGEGGPAVAVQGVTATEIHLGVGVPDLGALAALGPDYDFGDPQEHVEALLARWREEGRLPVHGRDIVPHYRRYDIVGTEEQRSACKGWALDDKVFAVMAVNQYWAQAECVTAEHKLPLLTTLSYYEESHRAAGEMLVDLQMSTERVLTNFANWAHDNGHLKDRRIGLYYATGTDGRPVRDAFIPTMKQLGYDFAVEITTDNHAYGSPSDNVAAQQFAANDVDLAVLFVSAINQTNFMQQAESQLYRPTYLVTDIISSTNDTATSTYPVEQYDGTFGLTNLRYGEEAAGMPKNGPAKVCEDNWAARSGDRVEYQERPAEWLMLMSGCDEGEVLMQALERVGPDLTVERFLDEIYRTTDLEMGLHSPVTLRRGVLGGTSAMRTLQWHGDCVCFHAVGDFQKRYGQ